MERRALEELSRDELVRLAEEHGVARPRVLTKDELVDELVRRTITSAEKRGRARGWLGRARDLLASMMEGAADARGRTPQATPSGPAPLATVTLAEIYAAQGHFARAVEVLDQVLAREPSHEEAKRLRERFAETQRGPRGAEPDEHAAKPEAMTMSDEPIDAPPDRAEAPAAASPTSAHTPSAGSSSAGTGSADAPSIDTPRADPSSADAPSIDPPRADPSSADAPSVDARVELEGSGPTKRTASPSSVEPGNAGDPPRTASAPLVVEAESPLTPGLVAELDEVVALSVSPERLFVYWEVRAESRDAARARAPGGELTLRVLTVQASWDGPEPELRDVPIDALVGDRFLGDIPPGAAIRVSVGWRSDDLFDPIAVGAEVRAPRATPTSTPSTTVRRWSLYEPDASAQGTLDPGALALHALAQASSPTAGPPSSAPEQGAVVSGVRTTVTRVAQALVPEAELGLSASTPSTLGERTVTYLRGGASDLVRIETFTPWGAALYGGASDLGLGGASDLGLGGASDLG